MARPSAADRLDHILRSIAAIEGYWAGKELSDFSAAINEPLRAATERHLLNISEASRHLPDQDKLSQPSIPWREIAGIGNILRHGYDVIDDRRIWDMVQADLDPLKAAIEAIRAGHP